jgi:predicted MPP superfamily phosphohydrolase
MPKRIWRETGRGRGFMRIQSGSFRKLILVFFAAAAFVIFIAVKVRLSYNSLVTVSYSVVPDKITDSVTICLIADLHDHRFGENNAELADCITGCSPDLILMAGDLINADSADSSAATELIRQLTETAPVYYSLGNQEVGYIKAGTSDLRRELEEAGAVLLEETYTDIVIGNNKICLGGMYGYAFAEDGSGHMDKDRIPPERRLFLEDFQKQDAFKLMMAHRPDSFIFGEAADTWDIDLAVSGHLHGGQVILPFLGGLYAGDQGFFPAYVYGQHHFGALKNLIITSGLGSDREKLPRFNNPPEVVKIVLE